MSQSKKDGIFIDNVIYIVDEKKEGFPIYMRLLQLFIVILGTWSISSILVESFSIPVSVTNVNLLLVLFSTILFVLFLLPSYDLVKTILFVLFYGLFWYSRLPRIKNALFIFENLIIDKIASYYGSINQYFQADYSTSVPDSTLFLTMLLIPVAALLAVGVIRSKYVYLSNIILFLPVSASFAFGIIPSEQYLIAYIIVMLFLTISCNSGHSKANREQKKVLHRISSRAAIWLSLLCLGLFFLMKLFVTPQEYGKAARIGELKAELQDFMYSFSLEDLTSGITNIKLPNQKNTAGGLGGGELGRVGEVVFHDSEQLRVLAPLSSVSEGIYLKGYVGSEYTGDSWNGHTKESKSKYKELLKKITVEDFPPVNQVNLLLNGFSRNRDSNGVFSQKSDTTGRDQYEFDQGKIKVEYLSANKKFIYAPYYTNYGLLADTEYQSDLYAAPTIRKDSYEFDYYYNVVLGDISTSEFNVDLIGKPGYYFQYEKLYRNYVYDVYTKLPEEGLERLKQDFFDENVKAGSNSITERINYVKDYLDSNTSYSLSPGKLPKGKDFVEYFLYESKLGYCAHYASAATLMLRAMGIPARYVEGYAFGASNIVEDPARARGENNQSVITTYSNNGISEYDTPQVALSVKDYNAHAWVEVYMDGCGWIPVDFTPGSSVEYNTSLVKDMEDIGDKFNQSNGAQVIPTIISATPTPQPETTEEAVQPTKLPDKETAGNSGLKGMGEQTKHRVIIVFIFLTLAAACIAYAGFMLHIRRKKTAKMTRNYSKRALLLYEEIEKILSNYRGSRKSRVSLEDNLDYMKEHCPYLEKEAFTSCMETVQKARFGRKTISSGELSIVEEFHQDLYGEVYDSLHFWRKIYLRFILLI